MSDTSEFVNAYIESSVNTLHEYLNQILQLKAQLKIINDSVAKKDATLSELQSQVDTLQAELNNASTTIQSSKDELLQIQVRDNETINKTREENRRLEEEHNALKGKLGEFETLAKQFNDLKKQYKEKDNENQKLLSELDSIKNPVKKKSPKKVINTKNIPTIQASNVTTENDDF